MSRGRISVGARDRLSDRDDLARVYTPGVGDVGPLAALPVMEGKAALLSTFASVDAWPLCLNSRPVDDIVRTIADVSTGVGAINLEDVAAPRCFELVSKLDESLNIPVFHDDQHGTAIIVLAALRKST